MAVRIAVARLSNWKVIRYCFHYWLFNKLPQLLKMLLGWSIHKCVTSLSCAEVTSCFWKIYWKKDLLKKKNLLNHSAQVEQTGWAVGVTRALCSMYVRLQEIMDQSVINRCENFVSPWRWWAHRKLMTRNELHPISNCNIMILLDRLTITYFVWLKFAFRIIKTWGEFILNSDEISTFLF